MINKLLSVSFLSLFFTCAVSLAAQSDVMTETQGETVPIEKGVEPQFPKKLTSYGPVEHNDTLWNIARQTKPDGIPIAVMKFALYNRNRQAFEIPCNMNSIKRGAILQVPTLEVLQKTNPREAEHTVVKHWKEWHQYRANGRVITCRDKKAIPKVAVEENSDHNSTRTGEQSNPLPSAHEEKATATQLPPVGAVATVSGEKKEDQANGQKATLPSNQEQSQGGVPPGVSPLEGMGTSQTTNSAQSVMPQAKEVSPDHKSAPLPQESEPHKKTDEKSVDASALPNPSAETKKSDHIAAAPEPIKGISGGAFAKPESLPSQEKKEEKKEQPLGANLAAPTKLTPEYKSDYPPGIDRIKKRGVLLVSQYNGERPGFFMYDNGDYQSLVGYEDNQKRVVGYDIEMANIIAKELGVPLKFQRNYKSFDDVCRAASTGETDIGISKLTVTMERAQYVNFTTPYVTQKVAVLINRLAETRIIAKMGNKTGVAKNSTNTKPGAVSIYDLLNRSEIKIGVQKGTSWVSYAKDLFPKAQLVQYAGMDETFSAAEKGEVIATLNDEWNVTSNLRVHPEITLKLRLAYVPGLQSTIAIAVSHENKDLANFINLLIESKDLDRTPSELLDRYYPDSAQSIANALAKAEKVKKDEGTQYTLIIMGFSVFLLLLFVWVILSLPKNRN